VNRVLERSIARLLGDDAVVAGAQQEAFGQLEPEQASSDGEPVRGGTDVYADRLCGEEKPAEQAERKKKAASRTGTIGMRPCQAARSRAAAV